jgi:hypothetical protein
VKEVYLDTPLDLSPKYVGMITFAKSRLSRMTNPLPSGNQRRVSGDTDGSDRASMSRRGKDSWDDATAGDDDGRGDGTMDVDDVVAVVTAAPIASSAFAQAEDDISTSSPPATPSSSPPPTSPSSPPSRTPPPPPDEGDDGDDDEDDEGEGEGEEDEESPSSRRRCRCG